MAVNLPGTTLRQLARLVKRKEALMAEIQAIDREMLRLDNEPGASHKRAPQTRVTISVSPGRAKRPAPRKKL